MKKRILMLGCGVMQAVAIRSAKERGWEVVAVDGNPEAPFRLLADRFEPIDLKDIERLKKLALSLKENGGLDAVFTAATDFSVPVAAIAETCGLPGHSLEAAINASDKLRMRECFRKAGVPSPRFAGIDRSSVCEASVLMQQENISYPVVVKPVDNMGARGCRRADSPDSLREALEDALCFSRTGRAIVEEYMDGPEFSLEALVFDNEIRMTGFADRHIAFSPYFVEMGHTIPTSLSASDRAQIEAVFFRGIRALGLSHGVAKGDLKLTDSGPMIGEIAGRLSGGFMSGWTFPYSSGIPLTANALDLAAGLPPSALTRLHDWTSAERAWISIPGSVRYVSGYEQAKSIPYLKDIFPRVSSGDTVRFPLNNVEKCGNCLSAAPDRLAAVDACLKAVRTICVRLEPFNADTDAYLSAGSATSTSFPPDAFPVYRIPEDDSWESTGTLAQFQIPASICGCLDTCFDWYGRSLRDAIRDMCVIEPALVPFLREAPLSIRIQAWNALVRGGIQGMLYVFDCHSHA